MSEWRGCSSWVRDAACGPWFLDTEPSTGSLYANMSALPTFMPPCVVPMSDGCASTIAAIIFSAASFSTPS